MKNMTAELVLQAENIVGESLVWDDRRRLLIWVDIIKKRIHTLDLNNNNHQTYSTPDFVTSVGLRADGGAIVGLLKTVCQWDFEGAFKPIAEIEADMPDNRLNEGVVGPDGAFWVGTMQNNIADDGSPKDITNHTGRIYRVLADGSARSVSQDQFGITNTFVWPRSDIFVTADTLKNEIYRYTLNDQTGEISTRTVINSGFERGLPDGSCIDAEGYIWNCRVVEGGCLMRMDPNGNIDRIVDLPCSWPTSCTFGGDDLDRLLVTSARFTMSDAHLKSAPHEGGLFALDVGVKGVKAHRFG